MHYLCLVFRQQSEVSDRDADEEAFALVEALVESGYDISAFPLAAADEATTLRRTGDGLVLSEGPATAASERIEAAYVLKARDLNDAVRIAAWLPGAGNAVVEIRSVREAPLRSAAQQACDLAAEEPPGAEPCPASVAG